MNFSRALPVCPLRAAIRLRSALVTGVVLACLGASSPSRAATPIHYLIDLRASETHQVRVTMTVLAAGAGTEIQFPAWNALYQIRDFVRNVEDVQAQCDERPIPLLRLDLETWKTGAEPCRRLEVRYSIYANAEGPYSAVLNDHHSFLNLALILFYLSRDRQRPTQVEFRLPDGWKLATLLDGPNARGEFEAPNYDALVDSPVEAGALEEYSYEQGGATYRIIVDAEPADYPADRLLSTLQKITATETALMRDVPSSRYTFIFHFPQTGGGGGMEHALGTAISIPQAEVRDNWVSVKAMVAHEFFHYWNVKRIRPRALEPVDYVRGNDTRDLWFSEGVTDTYKELVLLRSGLISREEFYQRLAAQIAELQSRPARLFQSAEESGLSAWLEKYPEYYRPERSISYYNKGELLGFMLDLALRQASHNRAGLDELMRRLDQDYARRGLFFALENLRALSLELAPGWAGREAFFRDNVAGTRELDYDTYLGYAGLRLLRTIIPEATLGFRAVRSFDQPIAVESVNPASDAAKAGLRRGDVLTAMNGRPLTELPEEQLAREPFAGKVDIEVSRSGQSLHIRYALTKSRTTTYRVEEIPNPTREQWRVREGWLEGRTSSGDIEQKDRRPGGPLRR